MGNSCSYKTRLDTVPIPVKEAANSLSPEQNRSPSVEGKKSSVHRCDTSFFFFQDIDENEKQNLVTFARQKNSDSYFAFPVNPRNRPKQTTLSEASFLKSFEAALAQNYALRIDTEESSPRSKESGKLMTQFFRGPSFMNHTPLQKDVHLITTPALEYTSNPFSENNEIIAMCQNTHGSIRLISQHQFHGAQQVQSQIRAMSPSLSNRRTISSHPEFYKSKERKIRNVDSNERQSSQKTEKRSFNRAAPHRTVHPYKDSLLRTERAKHQCFETLPIPEMESSPPVRKKENNILFEGVVYKFKPGLKNQYIQRYAVLTHKHFRYYKNKFAAHCWMSKPLMSIATADMASVERVYVTFTNLQMKDKKASQKKNCQFQIFLKESGRVQNAEQEHISILDQVLKKPGRSHQYSSRRSKQQLVQKSQDFKIRISMSGSAEKDILTRQSLQTPLQQIYPVVYRSKPDSSFLLSPRVEAGHMMRAPSPRRFKQLNLNISNTSRQNVNSSRERHHSRQASLLKQGSRAVTPTHFQLSGIKEEYKTGESEERLQSFKLQENKPYLGNISPTNCSHQKHNMSEMLSNSRDQSQVMFQSQLQKSGFENFIQNGKALESAHTVNRVQTIQTKNPSGWIKSLSGEKNSELRKCYMDESRDTVVSNRKQTSFFHRQRSRL